MAEESEEDLIKRRHDWMRDTEQANSDICERWRLLVTLDLRTPRSWLDRDGEEISFGSAIPDPPLQYAIWVPLLKTWRELGIDADEAPPSTRASQWGQVPEDGGQVLPYLKEFRALYEGELSAAEKEQGYSALFLRFPEFAADTSRWLERQARAERRAAKKAERSR